MNVFLSSFTLKTRRKEGIYFQPLNITVQKYLWINVYWEVFAQNGVGGM